MHRRLYACVASLALLALSPRAGAQEAAAGKAPGRPAADQKPRELIYGGKALPQWIELLKSPRDEQRADAAAAVGSLVTSVQSAFPALVEAAADRETGKLNTETLSVLQRLGPLVVPALTRSLWHDDKQVRLAALLTLRGMGTKARPAVPALTETFFKEEAPVVRRMAVEVVGNAGARIAIPALMRLLADEDADVRRAAISTLIDLGAEAKLLLPVLIEWTKSKDARQRQLGARSLGELHREAAPAVSALVKCLEDEQSGVRTTAIRSLGEIGVAAKHAVPVLASALESARRPSEQPLVAAALWQIARHPRCVAALKASLSSADGRDRVAVAEWLWRMDKNPLALATLADILKGDDRAQQMRAAQAVKRIGANAKDVLSALTPLLKSKDIDLRMLTITALGRLGEHAKPAAADLAALLKDGDARLRLPAAVALWRIGQQPPAIAALSEALKDKDPMAGVFAASALGRLGAEAKGAVPALEAALSARDGRLRLEAADALWAIRKHPGSLPVLVSVLADEDRENRYDAANRLGGTFFAEAEPAVPALVKALWDEESHVRSSAAEALGRIGPGAKQAAPALVALLQGESEEDHVCSATAEALGLIGSAAEPALLEKLHHADCYVRVSAALALSRIGKNRSGAAVVAAAEEDRNVRARICAAEARWHMDGQPAAVASLLEVLQEISLSDDSGVSNLRYMVARALGRIGPGAKAAAPALREMLDDEDQYLGTTAAAALRQIAPE